MLVEGLKNDEKKSWIRNSSAPCSSIPSKAASMARRTVSPKARMISSCVSA